MAVFVSGASGFIGARLVDRLIENGEDVHILCRPTSDLSLVNVAKVKRFHGDILDAKSVSAAMEGCSKAFHIAGYARNWAKNDATFFQVNVEGTKTVLEAAKNAGVKKAVVTSTSVTFGPSNGKATTESTRRTIPPYTTYESSKMSTEEAVDRYVHKGQDVVMVNPTRVFGPGALTEGNSLTKMIQLYLKGRFRFILGDGEGMGNYAYVEDIVDGHLKAMDKGRSGERYILGGENLSYNAFFDLVSDIAQKRFRMLHMPARLAIGYSQIEKWRATWLFGYPQITPDWVRTFLADWAFSCEKAERELGYTITPAKAALKTTIDWLDSQ